MVKYSSGRQKNLKVGIQSYSENLTSVEVIGKVGIGTTNAFANLQVDGSVILGGRRSDLIDVPGSFSSHLYPYGDGLYDIGRAPQIGLGANRWRNGNFTGKGTFDSGIDAHDIEIGVGAANLIYSTSGNLELNAQSGLTNIDDIVTISGNLGIGTTNPTTKVWVDGDGYFSGILTAQRLVSSVFGEFTGGSISGTNIVGTALSISGISTISGNLGIGSTTNPNSKLWVEGDGYFSGVVTATNFYVGDTLIGVRLSLGELYVGGISTFATGPVTMGLGIGNSTGTTNQILQVGSGAYISGNLGIGTTNPTSKLQVNGDGLFTGVVTATSFSGSGSGLTGVLSNNVVDVFDNNPYYPMISPVYSGTISNISVASTSIVFNPANNFLGIGTTNPLSNLHVVGNALITGIVTATDINSSSDIRLKKNIKKFENTLEKIDEINGVSFEWKESDSKSAGVIAQDLERVFPELVIDSSEYKKVNYNGLIGVLVESIKELKQEVQNLKSEIDILKYK